MLCTRLWGKARTMAHLPQVSIKPICCPCSDLCYLFFCNRQCRLFVFIASPHTISGASQDLSARDIHSPYGSRAAYGVSERLFTEAKHEKTVHLGHKLPAYASPDLRLSCTVTSSGSLDRQATDAPLPTHSFYKSCTYSTCLYDNRL